MILNLPSEIILEASSYLDFYEKLTLMTACSRLNDLIANNSLYKNLNLLSFYDNTETIVGSFERRQFNGAQVKTLEIDTSFISDQLYTKLPTIFPNLTRYTNYAGTEAKKEDSIIKPMLKWKNTLEKYVSSTDCPQLYYLMENNTFLGLREMELGSRSKYTPVGGYDAPAFLRCLKNTPMLSELTLSSCELDLNSLNEIHSGCPQLKKLELVQVNIIIDEDIWPQPIAPARSMLELHLCHGVNVFDTDAIFLLYILEKYPNLEQLKFYVNSSPDDLLQMLEDVYLDDRNAIHLRTIQFRATIEKYHEIQPNTLSKLSKSVEKLEMDTPLFKNVMQLLHESNVDLKILHFTWYKQELTKIFDSPDQLGYFKNMTSLKQMEISMHPSMQMFTDNIASATLTKLHVRLRDDRRNAAKYTVDLGWLLSIFPSLIELSIMQSDATIAVGEAYRTTTHPKFRKLSINKSPMKRDLLEFVKTTAPYLQELGWSLFGEASLENEQIKFDPYYGQFCCDLDLSGFRLDKLNLTMNRLDLIYDHNCYVDCYIKIKNQTKRLIFTDYCGGVMVVKSFYTKTTNRMTTLNIICDRMNQLNINGEVSIIKEKNKLMVVL